MNFLATVVRQGTDLDSLPLYLGTKIFSMGWPTYFTAHG